MTTARRARRVVAVAAGVAVTGILPATALAATAAPAQDAGIAPVGQRNADGLGAGQARAADPMTFQMPTAAGLHPVKKDSDSDNDSDGDSKADYGKLDNGYKGARGGYYGDPPKGGTGHQGHMHRSPSYYSGNQMSPLTYDGNRADDGKDRSKDYDPSTGYHGQPHPGLYTGTDQSRYDEERDNGYRKSAPLDVLFNR